MTYSEKDGTNWVYDYRATDSLAVSHYVSPSTRMYHQGGFYAESGFEGIGDNSSIPPYFGYQTYDTVGEMVSDRRQLEEENPESINGTPVYIATKEFDIEFYMALEEFVREDSIVYTEESLQQLRHDRTVDLLYSNGGYQVWAVNDD